MKKIAFFLPFLLIVFLPVSPLMAVMGPEEELELEPQTVAKETESEEIEEEEAEAPAEETASEESDESPVEGIVSGVKQVAYDGPKEFVEETAPISKKPTITRIVEGVNEGTRKLLDRTIKGTYKVATLGTSELESYEIEEPEKGSGEPTKIKISIPGT
jgi:hypothetical protein